MLEQNGGHIAPDRISTHNARHRRLHARDSTRQAILSDCGLQDDGTIKDAVTLNKLEDFNEFHRRLASA